LHTINYFHLIDFFVENGADLNYQDEARRTPLQRAISFGYIKFVKKLLSLPQINLYHQNLSGETALHVALSEKNYIC